MSEVKLQEVLRLRDNTLINLIYIILMLKRCNNDYPKIYDKIEIKARQTDWKFKKTMNLIQLPFSRLSIQIYPEVRLMRTANELRACLIPSILSITITGNIDYYRIWRR